MNFFKIVFSSPQSLPPRGLCRAIDMMARMDNVSECTNDKFIEQKLNYIHGNPCRGEWNLAVQQRDYHRGSAKYYITGEQGVYEVMSYTELENIDLTKKK